MVCDRSGIVIGMGCVDDDGVNVYGMDVLIDENVVAGRIVSVAYFLYASYNEFEVFVCVVCFGCVMGNMCVNGDVEEVYDFLIYFGYLCMGEFFEGFYSRDVDASISFDEFGGRAFMDFWSKVKDEYGVLKLCVNVEDVMIKFFKVFDKLSVCLVVVENGVVFESSKKMTWFEREAKI